MNTCDDDEYVLRFADEAPPERSEDAPAPVTKRPARPEFGHATDASITSDSCAEPYSLGQAQEPPPARGTAASGAGGNFQPPGQTYARSGVAMGLLIHILVLIGGIAAICFWPEDREQKMKVDLLLSSSTQAQEAVRQGDYRGAFWRYSAFLARAERSDVHAARLRAAIADARAELERIKPLMAKQGAAAATGPATRPGVVPDLRGQPAARGWRRQFPVTTRQAMP